MCWLPDYARLPPVLRVAFSGTVPIAGKWVLICALAVFQGTLWQNPGMFSKGSADVMAYEMPFLQEDILSTFTGSQRPGFDRVLTLGLCGGWDQVGTLWPS